MPENSLQLQGEDSTLSGTSFRVSFEATQVRGVGGFYTPRIVIPLRFESSGQQPDRLFILHDLSATLCHGNVSHEETADLLTRSLQIERCGLGTVSIALTLPLSSGLVAHIEELRGGKDLDLSLFLKINVFVKPSNQPVLAGTDSAKGLVQFQIPRSHWIDKILPKLGYLEKHILEVSVPSSDDVGSHFQKALKELKDAETQFRDDNYDGVLVNCRNAIDAIVSAFKLELGEDKASYKNRVEAFQKQYWSREYALPKPNLWGTHLSLCGGPLRQRQSPVPFRQTDQRQDTCFRLRRICSLILARCSQNKSIRPHSMRD